MTDSSENSGNGQTVSDLRQKAIKLLAKPEKLGAAAGSLGLVGLIDGFRRQKRNTDAEDAAVRKAKGWDGPSGDDDMGDISLILGDQNVNEKPDPAPEKKPVLGTVAALALGAAVPGAGLLGAAAMKYLGDQAQPVIEEKIDETVSLGLKRIGDLNPDEQSP